MRGRESSTATKMWRTIKLKGPSVYTKVIIHQGGIKIEKFLKLPLAIGPGASCKLITPAQDMDGVPLKLGQVKGALKLYQGAKELPLGFLKEFSLKACGVFSKPKFNIIEQLISWEKSILVKLPPFIQYLFLINEKDNKKRYLKLSAAIVCMAAPIVFMMSFISDNHRNVITDLSDKPHILRLGQTQEELFGNAASFKKNPRGIVYNLSLNKKQILQKSKISFKVWGLDLPQEVEIFINNKIIYQSNYEKSCIRHGCNKEIVIDSQLLNNGPNKILVKHNNPQSNYLFGKLTFIGLKPMDGVTEQRTSLYLDEAGELFSNRHITPMNLLKANEYVILIDKLSKSFDLGETYVAKAKTLKVEIKIALRDFKKNFWFMIEQKMKTKNIESAMEDLKEMQIYFPDPSTEDGRKVRDVMSRINHILGR